MADTTTQPFKPNSNQGLDIAALLSAPLVAATKANNMMLVAQKEFLLNTCFEKKKDGDEKYYDTRMVEMKFTRGDDALVFKLPLITLLPMNSLAVDQVTVDFEMEITTQSSDNNNTRLIGKVSGSEENSSHIRKSHAASKLKANINASPLPLPLGVTTLIDMYVKSISPTTEKVPNNDNP